MELSFQPEYEVEASWGYACFNPCFNGTIISTTTLTRNLKRDYEVSILVLMELSFQQENGKAARSEYGVFQSLF